MAKSIEEIRLIFEKAKADALKDDSIKNNLKNSFYKTLSSHPYNLTPEDMDLAHEDSLRANPQCPYYCLTGSVGRL